MRVHRRTATGLAALALMLGGCADEGGTPLSVTEAELRLLNAASAAPALDLLVDGQVAAAGIAYAGTSGVVGVGGGAHTLAVRNAMSGAVLATLDTVLVVGQRYDLLAGSESMSLVTPATVDTGQVQPDRAHVRIIVVAPPFIDSASAPPPELLDVHITPPGTDLVGRQPELGVDASHPSYSPLIYLDPGLWAVRFTGPGTAAEVAAILPVAIGAGEVRAVVLERQGGGWGVAVLVE